MRSDDGTSTVTFLFESPQASRVSTFTLKLMDIQQERLGIPPQEYKASVQLPSGEFQRISRDMVVIGDSVTLAVRKDEIKFSTAGDIGDGTISLRQGGTADKGDEVTVEVREPVTATFALKYFAQFTKATALADHVTLQLNAELPLVVEYKMGDVGEIRFYLAPKIDDAADAADDQ